MSWKDLRAKWRAAKVRRRRKRDMRPLFYDGITVAPRIEMKDCAPPSHGIEISEEEARELTGIVRRRPETKLWVPGDPR